MLGIPGIIVNHDVVHGLLAGQHGRQQDAVVIAVRLRAKHGDVVFVGVQLEQFLQGPHPGHAITDQHEFFFHRHYLNHALRFA